MTSFSFTPEQIKSAPPEVRRWFENEIATLLRELAGQRPQPAHSPELAACTTEETEALFGFSGTTSLPYRYCWNSDATANCKQQPFGTARPQPRRNKVQSAARRRPSRRLFRRDQPGVHALAR